jgi:hypothetical protein
MVQREPDGDLHHKDQDGEDVGHLEVGESRGKERVGGDHALKELIQQE